MKKDVKNVLKELWDAEEEPFYKISTNEYEKGMQKILRDSKVELQNLSCGDDDGTLHYLRKHGAGDVYMIVHYQYDLRTKELLPEDTDTLRFNSATRKDHVSFVNHPDAISLIISTGDITTTPPANIGLVEKFKVSCSPDDSSKM